MTVSEQAGHTSAAFTLDTCAHVLSRMKQGASDRLEILLRSGFGALRAHVEFKNTINSQ
jgi:hypothetical protein